MSVAAKTPLFFADMPSLLLSTRVVQDLEHLLQQTADKSASAALPASSSSYNSSSPGDDALAAPGILSQEIRSKLERCIAKPLPIEQDQDQDEGQQEQGSVKLSGSSRAIPPPSSSSSRSVNEEKPGVAEERRTEGVVIHHDELVELASQIRQLVRSQDGDEILQDLGLGEQISSRSLYAL